jgi:hypothetical protein
MDLAPQLLESRGDPAALEHLYRGDPASFSEAFPAVLAQYPDSGILLAWQARLNYVESASAVEPAAAGKPLSFAWVFGLALSAAILAKLPSVFSSDVQNFVYPRDTAFFILGPLAVYFALARRPGRCVVRLVAGVFAIAALFINALPGDPGTPSQNGLTLACLHLPLLLGWFTCVVYLSPSWRDLSARAELIRLLGEAIVYTSLVLLTGMVMTAVTLGLFAAVHSDIDELYMRWVVLMGAAAAPVVGMHLACQRLHGKTLIAPLLTRIISPLVLITLVVYLASLLPNIRALYSDRDFLIVFNIMSVCVLAIAAFGLCAWPSRSWLDYVLLALLALALIIDVIALSAILSRLSWYGLSVNRLAVLGANALLTVHLAGLLYQLARGLFRTNDLAPARRWLLRYLPVYSAWTALVVFLFPLLGWWLG